MTLNLFVWILRRRFNRWFNDARCRVNRKLRFFYDFAKSRFIVFKNSETKFAIQWSGKTFNVVFGEGCRVTFFQLKNKLFCCLDYCVRRIRFDSLNNGYDELLHTRTSLRLNDAALETQQSRNHEHRMLTRTWITRVL